MRIHPLQIASRVLAAWSAAVCLLSICETTNAADVLPLQISEPQADDTKETCDTLYTCAQKQAHFLLGQVKPWDKEPGLKLLTRSGSGEHFVRPNTGAIEGFAFLYRFGPYDPSVVGVSRRELLDETLIPMMRYIVATHKTGSQATDDGQPWGDAWQSAHWAQMLGRAAWFVWDDLPAELREGVRRVVIHEAERIARTSPPHQIRHDTKAEENAWNSQILSVAILLAPEDSRRESWEAAFQKWVMSSFLRPSDERNQHLIDGRSVAEQFSGANIYDDFTLENHGFVHPDYMQCFGLSLGCEVDFRLTGRKSPEAMQFNVAGIYENLKWFLLPDGGFVYPNGQDWRLFRNADWARSHLLMAAYGDDPDAWTWAMQSLGITRRMQARGSEGNIYLPEEFFFASTHTDGFRSLALCWLTLHTADPIQDEFSDRRGVRRLDHGKLILHRTDHAIHTFSWGARCMAQCVPYRLDRIVSPDVRNGVGHVRLAGGAPLAIRVVEADVNSDEDSFSASAVIEHGDQVRAYLQFHSAADGSWRMQERLVALTDMTTDEIATGLIGILNNSNWIYENGERQLSADENRITIESLSGKAIDLSGVREISVDDVLTIHSDQPLHASYMAAAKRDRGRVTDRLYLNYVGEKRTFRKGETISEFDVVVKCVVPKSEARPELEDTQPGPRERDMLCPM